MKNDARLSVGLQAHPKTKKLIRRHGAVGAWHLVCLFLWVAANRSDGDLSGMSDEDIELAVDWTGNAGEFVSALSDIGFLDGEPETYFVHDWADHNPWAAGANARSQKAKWNALIGHHGKDKAAEIMPDYYAQHVASKNAACARDAVSMRIATDGSAEECVQHAYSKNEQCSVSVSDTVSISDTVAGDHPPPPARPSPPMKSIADWNPRSETIDALCSHPSNVPPQFVSEQLLEFRIYWLDRGDEADSWDSKFLRRCIGEWKRNGSSWCAAPIPIRNGCTFEQLTDTSWADGLTGEAPSSLALRLLEH